jgi:GT2 family glycosyltransferase
MRAARVTAVVVTYRSADTVGTALDSLRPSHDAGLLDCIVVDNASDDGTADLVRAQHRWVRLLEAGGNLGFARGNNLALPHVRTPEVLFLNPDAALGPADLRALLAFLDRHPAAGAVGPLLCDAAGSTRPLHPFPTPGRVVRAALRPAAPPPPPPPGAPPQRADWLCGAALLVRRSMLEELVGFDPRFFLYFEETDLCYRASRRGYETWLHPGATARHTAHASARTTRRGLYHGCIAEHYFASRYYYLLKHYGGARATAAELVDFALTAARAAVRRLRGLAADDLLARLRARCLRTPAP